MEKLVLIGEKEGSALANIFEKATEVLDCPLEIVCEDLDEGTFDDLLKDMEQNNVRAVFSDTCYSGELFLKADFLSRQSKGCSSADLLVLDRGRLYGYSPFAQGFILSLPEYINVKNDGAILIGNAKEARSAYWALKDEGAKKIYILCKEGDYFEELLQDATEREVLIKSGEELLEACQNSALLVSASGEKEFRELVTDFEFLKETKLTVVDLAADPKGSDLIREAKRNSLLAFDCVNAQIYTAVCALLSIDPGAVTKEAAFEKIYGGLFSENE